MATLATQTIVPGGVAPTYAAAAGGGDNFIPDKDVFLHVKNGSGGSITVTVTVPSKYRGKTVTNEATAVPAGAERMIGPFPADVYADPANSGLGALGYSGVTSLTVGIFKLAEY